MMYASNEVADPWSPKVVSDAATGTSADPVDFLRSEKAGYQPGDFDPYQMTRDELRRFEKGGYQQGDFNGRDVTQSGDTLTKLFVRNYGRQPTAEELIQRGNVG